MNRTCASCNGEATTDCDKCGQRLCRACAVLKPLTRGELKIIHKVCPRKNESAKSKKKRGVKA